MSGGVTHSPRGEKANFSCASVAARAPGFSGPAASATRDAAGAGPAGGAVLARGAKASGAASPSSFALSSSQGARTRGEPRHGVLERDGFGGRLATKSERPPRHRLHRQGRMNGRADRNHGEARLILALRLVETGLGTVFFRLHPQPVPFSRRAGEPDARGSGQREDCDSRKGRPCRRHAPARARKQVTGQGEQGVADHPAQSARQRPASRRRKKRRERGGRRDTSDIEARLHAQAVEPALGQELPAPEGGRRERGDTGEAEQLHGDVGGDRARLAQEVVDWRAGRMIEARVGDRPGEKGKAEPHNTGERGEAHHLGRAALRKFAHRRWQIIEHRERRRTHADPPAGVARPRAPRPS